jgi:hypothetical protein
MKPLHTFQEFLNESLNESSNTAIDFSDKSTALALPTKLPAKYRKDIKVSVYNAPAVQVAHGARVNNLPQPSRTFRWDKLIETSRNSDEWIALTAVAVVEDTANRVTFFTVYEEFDPIDLNDLKSNRDLYAEDTYKDETDLIKKMQAWFSKAEKLLKEIKADY